MIYRISLETREDFLPWESSSRFVEDLTEADREGQERGIYIWYLRGNEYCYYGE